ncbi:MAG: autotransporter assembly complex family protein [Pseudomonadota bacterium]
MKKAVSYIIRAMAPASGWRCLFWYSLLIGLYLSIDFVHPITLSAEHGLRYTVTFEGVADQEMIRLLESVSDTVAFRERPPVSINRLKRRVSQDIPRLHDALRSMGFYGARVTSEIKEDVTPVQIIIRIETGSPYVLKSVDIEISAGDDAKDLKIPDKEELGLFLEKPARSKSILEGEKELIRVVQSRGFPYARISERKVVVDHAAQGVYVHFILLPGPRARFGSTEIKGLESVDDHYLRSKIPWKGGESFNAELLREARGRLIETGLFTTVEVRMGEKPDRQGALPVIIQVKERKHRTVKTGVSYQTDEGPGGKVSWEHQNFFHHGERLTFSGTGSGIGFAAGGRLRKPEFLRSNQALLLEMRLAEDRPDAFTSRNVTSTVAIERSLAKGLDASVGLAYRVSKIEQFGREDHFSLFSLPMRLDWNSTDNILDASKGGDLKLQITPYYDTYGEDLNYFKGYASYSRYLRLSRHPYSVLAAKGTLGTISGASRDAIPADIRFYAGGGGSIRGYAYQSVGPLRGGDPIGGRSLIGISSEWRVKVTDTTGFVVFMDGGNVYETKFPDFDEPLRWGAGAGFRYFTPIGPLRLDVAVPINRRREMDDRFQVYVSIGQAF